MKNSYLGFIYMGITSLIWGLGYTFIKICTGIFDPFSLGLARFIFSSILFLPFFLKNFRKIESRDFLIIFIMALTGLTIYQFFYNYGASGISADLASILISTEPIFILLLSYKIFKEKITKKLFGIMISFIGIIFVFYRGIGSINNTIDISFILIASILWSIYTVISKTILEKYDPMLVISAVTIFGAITLLPFIPNMIHEIVKINSLELYSLIFLVVFGTFLAPYFNFKGLKLLSATNAGVFYYLSPFFTILSAYIILNENLSLTIIIGGILIIGGVAMVDFTKS
ncbi:MAG: DMT family transporter [Thermoplasmata archaeon]|nr:DMT family transporter [Thermoplasmata archaeon]